MGAYRIGSKNMYYRQSNGLQGRLSIPVDRVVEHEVYDGVYVVTPGEEEQILHTGNKLLNADIVIQAVSSYIPEGSEMATEGELNEVIQEVFGSQSGQDPDAPSYDPNDIATEEELESVITDVFG